MKARNVESRKACPRIPKRIVMSKRSLGKLADMIEAPPRLTPLLRRIIKESTK